MGITISEIQDKTLLKYAKTADVDEDGKLNEEESASLFTTLDSKCSEAEEQQQFWKRQDSGISDDIIAGVGIALGTVLSLKKHKNIIDFGFLSVIGTGINYIADKIMKHTRANKVEKLNSAISEFNQLKNQAA